LGRLRLAQSPSINLVPGGAYGYAACDVTVSVVPLTQPVLDLMGTVPLDGSAFMYQLLLDNHRPRFQKIYGDVEHE
jgi:hypothetical protein